MITFGVIQPTDGSPACIITSATKYWKKTGYMSDNYTGKQYKALEKGFKSVGLQVYELEESNWENDGNETADQLRAKLMNAPDFVYDPDFEKKFTW